MPWYQDTIAAPDRAAAEAALQRQAQLTKPPGSLGQLEALAVQLASLQGGAPALERVAIRVFAADHGVCAEGVSAFPQAVTVEMIRNFASGGAAISVLARLHGADFKVVNMGTANPAPEAAAIEQRAIAPGTANFCHSAAMTALQAEQALRGGAEAAESAVRDSQAQLFIGGEMGIGNTTAAAALACALLALPAQQLVGAGTGVAGAALANKLAVVERALALHNDSDDAAILLARLGGFEIAALAGAYLRCAQLGVPVLVDGFICTVAALLACRLQPALRPWLLFSHQSAEAGHQRVLAALEAQPLLALGMRLGEGSGAAIALPLLRQACALHNQMATFADAGVSTQTD